MATTRGASRNRNQLGSSNKTSPKVNDSSTQRALDQVYKEINQLKQSSSSSVNLSISKPNEGSDGDIRLYTCLLYTSDAADE